ncbi:MAG: pyridoxamine 5'-phosphate oxidase [Chitinophagaceae bacterium]|nr:pyridoxamine 5'-phosphate oxidase [Chitinophagaceae bacterium]MBL0055516.1 pyridoxamine 5'-phosphate oxidase [Chitinophagaceae bacterium]
MPAIADIRKEYMKQSLLEEEVEQDPFSQFGKWWDEAVKSEVEEANAMTLATATADGKPSARIVLLKAATPQGFVFYTNYSSHKGQQLAENPLACLVFFWTSLERQIRIEGTVEKVSEGESDEYFHSRPSDSRLGAWASPQSSVIPSRDTIEENLAHYLKKYPEGHIPRPPHWGGYLVRPVQIEFWQGRPSRLHDRILYTLQPDGGWKIERLAP